MTGRSFWRWSNERKTGTAFVDSILVSVVRMADEDDHSCLFSGLCALVNQTEDWRPACSDTGYAERGSALDKRAGKRCGSTKSGMS